MNGDFDLYVLNGKLKELKEVNGQLEDNLIKIKNDICIIGDKMEDLSANADLVGINKTIGTSFHHSLDELLAAKLGIRGFPGMHFTIKNKDTLKEFEIQITTDDIRFEDQNSFYYQKNIPLPLGNYSILIHSFYGAEEKWVDTILHDVGKISLLRYDTTYEIAKITESGDYTLPFDTIYVDIIGGGGGGGAGGGVGSLYGGSGGGGGAGRNGDSVQKKIIQKGKGNLISIIIGEGGIGAKRKSESGTSGKPSIIEDIITVSGGQAGSGGKDGTHAGASNPNIGGEGGIYGGQNGKSAIGSSPATVARGGQIGNPATIFEGNGHGGDGGDGSYYSRDTTSSLVAPGLGKNGTHGMVRILGGVCFS